MAYKSRYGLRGQEVSNLQNRYASHNLSEGFGSFDNFLRFCVASNFQSGCVMKRRDISKPHSPGNTFFVMRKKPIQKPKVQEKPEKPSAKSPCESCKLECQVHSIGCAEYRELYKRYWDEYIHQDIKQEPRKKKREAFQYEHPDLVREGIVFEHCQGIP